MILFLRTDWYLRTYMMYGSIFTVHGRRRQHRTTTLNRRLYITTDFSTISSNKIGIEFTFVNNKTQIICGVCSFLHDFLAVIVLENVGEFVVV